MRPPWTVGPKSPLSWAFSGKNTGVGCHFLLQEILPTQGLNPGLPHCRQMLYCLSHQGSTYACGIAIPQSGLLSQGSSLRLPSGHSGLVLTIRNAARASLFSPSLLVVDASIWATSPLGVAVRHIICGFYLFIFSSRLCCLLRFQNFPQTCW